MAHSRYCLLPVVLIVCVIAMLFVCLGLTIGLGHKTGDVFISDTGAVSPERGIFTLTLNLGAFGVAILLILNYRYVTQYGGPTKLNRATLAVGLLAALGLSIVGAFQWLEALVPHMVGATMVFVFGTVYAWLSTVLTYKLRTTGTSVWTFRLRVFLTVLVTVSFVPFAVTIGLVFTRTVNTSEMRVTAVMFEWILGLLLLVYIATMAWELRKVRTVTVFLDVEGFFDLRKTAKFSSCAVISNVAIV